MARRVLLQGHARQAINDALVANVQQALYVHPRNYTTEMVPMVDATTRFIAVPPVASSWAPIGGPQGPLQSPDRGQADVRVLVPQAGVSQHLLLPSVPVAVELFRADEFWFAFNTTADTQVGAYVPASTRVVYPLNPGVAGSTLAFSSVTNTGKLRVNWRQD